MKQFRILFAVIMLMITSTMMAQNETDTVYYKEYDKVFKYFN